ncbi:MAG: hypothetical protein ACOC5T_08255 [Elusimicrobiota bacterium]
MKIEQEQLDSLNQLDRIEYRLIEDKIKRKTEPSNSIYTVNLFIVGLITFFFGYCCQMELFMNIGFMGMVVSFFFLVFEIIYNIYQLNQKNKLTEEFLEKRYFDIKKKK